ncbi:hypothetical protein ACFSTC_20840 [Nonomuraea ferruginea]
MARGTSEADLAVGPDGSYMALAMSFPPDVDVEDLMTSDVPGLCLVGSYGHIKVRGGHVTQSSIVIDLRPRRPSDPPSSSSPRCWRRRKACWTRRSAPDGLCAGSKKYRRSA